MTANRRDRNFVGELGNPNKYDIDSFVVAVIIRDEEDNLLYGCTSYMSDIPAREKIPFSVKAPHNIKVTDNFEVYAYKGSFN